MVQKRRTRAAWKKLVGDWRASGKTAEQFSTRHGIKPSTLKWWAWNFAGELNASKNSVALVPMKLAAQVLPNVGAFDIEVGDVRFRFEGATDPCYVAAVVHAVARDDGGR
jgi:hypothetical protein